MRLAAFMMMCTAAWAQTLDRTKAPDTPPLAGFKLPPVHESTLGNGLRILLVEDNRFPMVEVRLGFQAGSVYDPERLSGLAETAAALLREGTTSRNARRLAEELTAIGGDLNASATPDFLTISGYALSENTSKLLELLADMAMTANFPEEEVRLRKANRIQELAAERSQAGVLADEKFRQVVYGSHPYSRTLPTPESIGRITREDLRTFRDARLVPNQAILVIAGAAGDRGALLRRIEARFGGWPRREAAPAPAPRLEAPRRSVTLVDRPGSVQADVRVGRWVPTRDHADYFPLLVASSILGTGTSSRMFMNIREKQGFAYHAGVHLLPRKVSGVVETSTEVRNEVVEQAMEAVFTEMRRMGAERVTATELSSTKNYLQGNFVMGLETSSGVANQLLSVRQNGLSNQYLETYVDKVRRVEPDQIEEVSKKYLNPEEAAIVVVGEAARIGESLKKLGAVNIEKAK